MSSYVHEGWLGACAFVDSLQVRDLMDASRDGPDPPDRRGNARVGHHERSYAQVGGQGIGQCHVYMVLPGATRFTTAGHFQIEPNLDGIPQGRFVYCRSYLDNPDAVPIDPVVLNRLNDTVYRTTIFNGVFGSFHDASPQGWGRRIIKPTASLKLRDEIDYMLQSPDDRMGALGFGRHPEPPAPKRNFHRISDLARLAALVETINVKNKIPEETDSDRIRDMTPFRTSMGGNRRKAVVEDAEGLWLVKFERHLHENHVRIERAMLELAEICDIRCPRNRVETVGGRDVLLVKRFDREKSDRGYLRFRMVSGRTMLRTDAPPSPSKWMDWKSYASLAEKMRRIVARPEEDSKELFRRMVFNALISNTDDVPRNHAIIAKRAEWKLSPAYDLHPEMKQLGLERRYLAMNCGIHGLQANAANLLSECGRYCLAKEEAEAIIDAMEERIGNRWYRIARNAGVSETVCEKISPAFVYPGFRRAPENSALS